MPYLIRKEQITEAVSSSGLFDEFIHRTFRILIAIIKFIILTTYPDLFPLQQENLVFHQQLSQFVLYIMKNNYFSMQSKYCFKLMCVIIIECIPTFVNFTICVNKC